ncbi:MAG: hypothetical protein V8R64_16715 [Thomasclavelia sp.]
MYTGISKRNSWKEIKSVEKKTKRTEDEIVAYADKAVERLQKRFRRMVLRGKPYNVAIMAVARELAGFIWGMETGRI